MLRQAVPAPATPTSVRAGRADRPPINVTAGSRQVGEPVVADGRRVVGIAGFDRPLEAAVLQVAKRAVDPPRRKSFCRSTPRTSSCIVPKRVRGCNHDTPRSGSS